MKNVLTINVPFTAPWAVPYGSAVVNGILDHHGYNTTAWDLNIDLIKEFENHKDFNLFSQTSSIGGYAHAKIPKAFIKKVLSWVKQELTAKLKKHNPDVILFSVFSSHSVDFAVPLTTLTRELIPNAYILMGGRGLDNIERQTQMSYGQFYAKFLPVDATYMGDAENQLIEVLDKKYQGCFVARPVSSTELENVPPAVWEGLDFSKYNGYASKELRIPLTASKGCVRECTFCDVAGSWPKYIYKKGELVGEEIVNLYHKTGINKFEFTDNLVNGSISNFRAMNTVIANKLPNVIDYLGYAICRPKESMPESDFELASVAGAKIFKVGIESGSEKVRHDIKKKFSNDDIDWFARNCANYNIKQIWLMFVGYPTETESDFNESLRLLKEYSTFAKQGRITVFLSSPMMLTSNSGFMRNYSQAYGLEHNREDSWSDFFWTSNLFTDNTFEVRVDRWKRFMQAIIDYGYLDSSQRQQEKFIEVEGLEKIYKEYKHAKRTKIIPIIEAGINFNKDTHL